MSSFIDYNYRSITEDNFVDNTPEVIPKPGDSFRDDPKGNDTLKLSNCRNVVVSNKTIWNWREDCLDLCRVHGAVLSNLILYPLGPNGITVKGASSDNLVEFALMRHGSRCDVELGQFDNYWYPGRPPTRDTHIVVLGVVPAKILLWDSTEPKVEGPHTIRRIPKFVWFPYFLFRYTQLRLENVYRRIKKLPLIKTK